MTEAEIICETLGRHFITMRGISGSRRLHCTSPASLMTSFFARNMSLFPVELRGNIDVVLLQRGEDNWVLHHAKWHREREREREKETAVTLLLERIIPVGGGLCWFWPHYTRQDTTQKGVPHFKSNTYKIQLFLYFMFPTTELVGTKSAKFTPYFHK
jgi:hypothetical protein